MENISKILVGFGGATASFLFGGWSALLSILIVLVGMDYLTGILVAGSEGRLNSRTGLRGISRKVLIFSIVAVGHLVDVVLGDAHLLRDTTIFFYLANEVLSIVENCGRLGLPIPPKVIRAVEVREKEGMHK